MKSRNAFFVGTALAVMLGSTAAQAAELWDNGGPAADSVYCNSNGFNSCSGGTGWIVYDDFQINSNSTVTGFTYDSHFRTSPADYVSTNWSIWSSDPRTTFASGPFVSGTSTGVNTVDAIGFTLTTVTGLNVDLAAGTYWLGLQNNANGASTTYVTSGTSKLGPASQSDNNGDFVNPSIADASFTVEGTAAVPEPATWAMMLLGFGGLGAMLRSRRRAALAA